MEQFLLITDDPGRSAALARDLDVGMACRIHDFNAEAVPAEPAAALVSDLSDLGPEAAARLRHLRTRARRGAPLVVLLRQDNPRARLQAIALGAAQILSPPFDLGLIQTALNLPQVPGEPLDPGVRRRAEAARQFYGTVFVPDRPITPVVIDNGTELVEHAIRDTGIRDWIRAVRRFDDATHQHCLIVAGLAAAFAGSLGLGPSERHRLTKAALLHDVGKIHVPAAILNKPGRLDPAEMALMRLHPEQGEAMLADQDFAPEQLAVVRSHHEMLDGSGYPDGLKAEAIPDLVRLVTVCDIYGALIERRAYKPPMAGAAAYGILKDMVGKLDPALVNAFEPVAAAFNPHIPCDT